MSSVGGAGDTDDSGTSGSGLRIGGGTGRDGEPAIVALALTAGAEMIDAVGIGSTAPRGQR